MKKGIIGILCALMALIGVNAYAQTTTVTTTTPTMVTTTSMPEANYDRTARLDLGVYLADHASDTSSIDDSFWIGGNLSYGILPWLAIGADGGWTRAGTSSANNNVDLDVSEAMGDFIFRVPSGVYGWNERLIPYGVVGLGAIWTNTRKGNTGVLTNRHGSAFGWKLGGGADWFLNEHWALNFEADYYSAEDDVPVSNVPGQDKQISFWTIGGGLKFVF